MIDYINAKINIFILINENPRDNFVLSTETEL